MGLGAGCVCGAGDLIAVTKDQPDNRQMLDLQVIVGVGRAECGAVPPTYSPGSTLPIPVLLLPAAGQVVEAPLMVKEPRTELTIWDFLAINRQ